MNNVTVFVGKKRFGPYGSLREALKFQGWRISWALYCDALEQGVLDFFMLSERKVKR